jgi:hypothetical protein
MELKLLPYAASIRDESDGVAISVLAIHFDWAL